MKLHTGRLASFLLDLDGQTGDEAKLVKRFLVLLSPVPALGRTIEVVEGIRTDDAEHGRPLVLECGLQHRDHLLLVARERPRHEGRAADNRLSAQVERGQVVGLAGRPPQVLVQVGRRRDLSLGQAGAAARYFR